MQGQLAASLGRAASSGASVAQRLHARLCAAASSQLSGRVKCGRADSRRATGDRGAGRGAAANDDGGSGDDSRDSECDDDDDVSGPWVWLVSAAEEDNNALAQGLALVLALVACASEPTGESTGEFTAGADEAPVHSAQEPSAAKSSQTSKKQLKRGGGSSGSSEGSSGSDGSDSGSSDGNYNGRKKRRRAGKAGGPSHARIRQASSPAAAPAITAAAGGARRTAIVALGLRAWGRWLARAAARGVRRSSAALAALDLLCASIAALAAHPLLAAAATTAAPCATAVAAGPRRTAGSDGGRSSRAALRWLVAQLARRLGGLRADDFAPPAADGTTKSGGPADDAGRVASDADDGGDAGGSDSGGFGRQALGAAPRKRRRARLRSRNAVIDKWLEDENGNDAYADLEGFIVD